MIAAVVDAWPVDLGDVEEILHDLRVLEGFILDLGQSAQINLVATLFLRGRDESKQGCDADGCRQPEAEQIHDILPFKMMFGWKKGFGPPLRRTILRNENLEMAQNY
jgi:hypothetical protein